MKNCIRLLQKEDGKAPLALHPESTVHLGLEIQLESKRLKLISALRKQEKREKTYGYGTVRRQMW